MKLLAYGFMLFFTLSGMKQCDKPDKGSMVGLNETFDLELDETVIIKGENIGISFTKATESRCPLNVNCMRAGEAKATFKVATKNDNTNIVLEAKGNCQEMDGSCGESKKALGYTVKLLNISPYPGTDEAKNKEVRKAKLQVVKN